MKYLLIALFFGFSHLSVADTIIRENRQYTAWDNATVLDKESNLLWEVKQTDNKQVLYHWTDAMQFCKELALGAPNKWRLPSVEELITLISETESEKNGYINSDFFPNNSPSSYWSSTEGYAHTGWYVEFDIGEDGNYDDGNEKYARCVSLSEN